VHRGWIYFQIVDGPQAAMIVGEMKLIVDCFWRDTKKLDTAQVYNLTADPSELHNLLPSQPQLLNPLVERLSYWEALSVPPYAEAGIDTSCGDGKPQGTPPHWDAWC
jgi:hypothetical protein